MSNPKKKGSGIKLWSVMTVVLVILLVASIIGTNVALSAAQAINIFLKTSTYKVVDNGDGSDSIYYESEYSSREELEAAGKSIAEQVEAEDAVLLINNGALPLASGSKVSTVSHSSIDIVTCGNGAADIDTSDAPSLKEALEEVVYVVNPTLWDFYATGAGSAYIREPGKLSNQTEGASRDQYIINEVPQSVYTADVKSSFAEYADAAIVTISRISGEGADLANNGFRDGTNILELTDNEKDMMQMAQDNFETVIVLINSTNAVDCSFLYDYEVDAALWIGYTGEWGLNAVADILVGNVNPSGHLVDTYTFDNNSAPAVVGLYGGNFSNYSAEDTRFYDVFGAQLDGNHTYITYLEGIYVGYRYGAYYSTADMPIPMVADCADYETYRSGKFIPGIMGTLFSPVDKLVSSLSATVVSIALLFIGVNDLPTKTTPYVEGMNWVVIALFCLVPMVAWVLTLAAMKGYELDGQRVKTVQAVNAARKAAVASGMSMEEAMSTITDETVTK